MDEKEKKETPEVNAESAEFDVKNASRHALEAFALKQREDIKEYGENTMELGCQVEGLDEQCSELAAENQRLRAQISAAASAPARTKREGRAPMYVPPRKLEGMQLEQATKRFMKRYGGKVVVHVGPTFKYVKDDKGNEKRVRDETKATHEPLKAEHIIGINETEKFLVAILRDTKKLRIERSGDSNKK